MLADRAPLARVGGMMTLTDVYCLYNRARGTELISPDDLLEACELFSKLRLGLHIREFPSYVTAAGRVLFCCAGVLGL